MVTPSAVFAKGKAKEDIVNGYLARLSSIPCKLFNFGNGYCRFAPNCNYAHLNTDGSAAVDRDGAQSKGQRRSSSSGGRRNNIPYRRPNQVASPLSPPELLVYDRVRATLGRPDDEQFRLLFRLLSRMGLSQRSIVEHLAGEDSDYDDDDDDELVLSSDYDSEEDDDEESDDYFYGSDSEDDELMENLFDRFGADPCFNMPSADATRLSDRLPFLRLALRGIIEYEAVDTIVRDIDYDELYRRDRETEVGHTKRVYYVAKMLAARASARQTLVGFNIRR